MNKDKKILEILNSKPSQKIGLDDFYGRQTVINMLNEAINYSQCCTELKAFKNDAEGFEKLNQANDLIEKHVTEQLRLNDVSNRRELLIAFAKFCRSELPLSLFDSVEQNVDRFDGNL